MLHRAISRGLALAALCLTAACSGATSDEPAPTRDTAAPSDAIALAVEGPDMGLVSSLPLYWPAGAEVDAIAGGVVGKPWQRLAIERQFAIVPLDTLSAIPGLSPDDPETDPLADLDRLAIVQPRGLSPADNVALDNWVKGGGRLLLVLDPLLTGEYEFALGDPRRPTDTALIPPVVARWGLSMTFDEDQDAALAGVTYPGGLLFRSMSGELTVDSGSASSCDILAERMLAKCRIGKGSVTLLADAALFEFPPAEPSPVARVAPAPIPPLLKFAFE